MAIDYALCVDLLGLNANQFILSKSAPPHTIIDWSGPDSQPTEAEFKEAWDKYEAEQAAQEYARNRQAEYPSVQELVVALYDTDDKSAVEAKRAAVKAKYPKP